MMGSTLGVASISKVMMGSTLEVASISKVMMGSTLEVASISKVMMGSTLEVASISKAMTTHEHESFIEEFECVDPEVGEQYLHGYVAETLSEDQRQDFDDHLVFCHKCQEDLEYLRWAVQQLKTHWTPTIMPLPVTSLVDGNLQDWLHDYYEEPLIDQLAASKKTAGAVSFPITVKYAKGQVIGQFLKRGKQLFFRLKKSSNDCTLIYRAPSAPSESKTFEFREGQDKRLGPFSEFIPSNTIQGMLAAIKQFHLFMKQKE